MYDVVVGRSESDKKKFGTKGAVFMGKHYVHMGSTTSLSNKIYLDVTRSHVVFLCGKRGSGKCLTGETLITLSDGSIKPIRELEQNDSDVLSLNQNLKIQENEKQGFYLQEVGMLFRKTQLRLFLLVAVILISFQLHF